MNKGYVQMYREIFYDLIDKKVGKSAVIVYYGLLAHRNTETNECFPSYKNLTEELHMDKKTIATALSELEEKGFIKINSGKQGVANNYYFPKEPFYKEWKMDATQLSAHRRKKTFKKKKDVDTTKWWEYDDDEEYEDDDGLLSWG